MSDDERAKFSRTLIPGATAIPGGRGLYGGATASKARAVDAALVPEAGSGVRPKIDPVTSTSTSSPPHALIAEYASSVPERVRALARAVERAKQHRDGAAYSEAIALAHRLRGTAGAYGFADLGRAAGDLEDALDLLNRGVRAGGAWSTIRRALDVANAVTAGVEVDAGRALPQVTAGVGVAVGRVLLVDDDPLVASAFRAAAARALVEIVTTASADEAERRVEAENFNLVVVGHARGDRVRALDLTRRMKLKAPLASGVRFALVVDAEEAEERLLAAHLGVDFTIGRAMSVPDLTRFVAAIVTHDRPARAALVFAESLRERAQLRASLEKSGRDVSSTRSLDELAARVAQGEIDACVVRATDDVTALSACRLVRANAPRATVVLLVDVLDDDVRRTALEAGADDVLVPHDTDAIAAIVEQRGGRGGPVFEGDRDAWSKLRLGPDVLEDAARWLAECDRQKRGFSFGLVAIDQGNAARKMLRERIHPTLARIALTRTRAADLVGRLGDRCLVIACPGEGAQVLAEVARQIIADLASLQFRASAGLPIPDVGPAGSVVSGFRASAGVASRPGDGRSIADLLHAANRRLGRALVDARTRVFSAD